MRGRELAGYCWLHPARTRRTRLTTPNYYLTQRLNDLHTYFHRDQHFIQARPFERRVDIVLTRRQVRSRQTELSQSRTIRASRTIVVSYGKPKASWASTAYCTALGSLSNPSAMFRYCSTICTSTSNPCDRSSDFFSPLLPALQCVRKLGCVEVTNQNFGASLQRHRLQLHTDAKSHLGHPSVPAITPLATQPKTLPSLGLH